jgi:2'-hydroxyisoflavone reductase
MRLLVLGGTVFLGRAVARQAVAAGHEVTCVARGESGRQVAGVRFVRADRDNPEALAPLRGEQFDAVIDVSRRPSHARRAVAALRDSVAHAVYVSSCSAYADNATPGQRADTAPLLDPFPDGRDEADIATDPQAYGQAKVASEIAFRTGFGPERTFVCRAGLIEGPEDEMNRYAYWVRRMAAGGDVLVPGRPENVAQLIDVRDLADWLLVAARDRLAGTYDGTGRPMPWAELMAATVAGVGTSPAPRLSWVDQEFLQNEGVRPWAGDRSLPLWLPMPDYGGFLARDVAPSFEAGLVCRPLSDTARDMWAWLRERQPAENPGITRGDEAALLQKWRHE